MTPDDDYMITFQSRNREAFGFKGSEVVNLAAAPVMFPSRNREAFGFKSGNSDLKLWHRLVSISESRGFWVQVFADG